jgi:hypothetical protein
MLIYAGIDEAGYGPIFGPLVVARAVFAVGEDGPPPPPLWTLLRATVCRKVTDRKGRIAINDSKRVYSTTIGLRHLERGVLSFLGALGVAPSSLDELLAAVSCDDEWCSLRHPWETDPAGGPTLPVAAPARELARASQRLRRAGERTGVRLLEARGSVVLPERFNGLLDETHSKASCSWRFVSGHLTSIWERHAAARPYVVIDRQGGRRDYGELLQRLFPEAMVRCLATERAVSAYEISEAERSMIVVCQVESEASHLPVALASMTAKYLRELFMMRFQAYWRVQAPSVRPTFGYHGDGRRFLGEIHPLLADLSIARHTLVRCR